MVILFFTIQNYCFVLSAEHCDLVSCLPYAKFLVLPFSEKIITQVVTENNSIKQMSHAHLETIHCYKYGQTQELRSGGANQ